MSVVISVENVSKMYRLGEVGTGTISHDLNRWWHKVRGKDDPYLKIGESNDRSSKGSSEYVYALKDINFEVKEGEVLGIIGKNGAGKSTLLKLLSRVTSPTSGRIRIKGRTASLLEVGTGFHPELTGRENIFLNGAILGMTKAEIRSKFDEIVDFSGVERYIDTPVKRYSSGMYVRLAFAVAAHLDPEILIVDEVLAVGDAEFQKKCIGKMGDISKNEGRTILFVSHNMSAVRTLCTSGLVLYDGSIGYQGNIENCLNKYGEHVADLNCQLYFEDPILRPSTDLVELVSIRLTNFEECPIMGFNYYDGALISVEYIIKDGRFELYPNLHFFDKEDNYIFVTSIPQEKIINEPGHYKAVFRIEPNMLNVGLVKIGVAITAYPGTNVQFFINPAIIIEVREDSLKFRNSPYTGVWPGKFRFELNTSVTAIQSN